MKEHSSYSPDLLFVFRDVYRAGQCTTRRVITSSTSAATPTHTAKGIYVSEFDSKSGALSAPRLVAESVSPAQLWVAPNGRFLYAANWQGSTDPIPANTISAYAIDGRTGELTFINKVSSGGLGPNQVVVDPSGKIAVAVNYRSGSVAAFGLESDGRITDAFYIDQHEGQPQPPSKQPGPRAHGVVFSSDSRFAYVADIGLDRVYSYRLDAAKRTMAPLDPPYVAQPAGSGPRRLQLHPNGRFLYLARESDSHVSVFAVDNGRLKEIQSLTDAARRLHRRTTRRRRSSSIQPAGSCTSRTAGMAVSRCTPSTAPGSCPSSNTRRRAAARRATSRSIRPASTCFRRTRTRKTSSSCASTARRAG